MHRFLPYFLLLVTGFTHANQAFAQQPVNIIPKPLSVETRPGAFVINENTRIYYENGAKNMDLPANYLAGLIIPNLRTKVFSRDMAGNDLDNVIYFSQDNTLQNNEAYTLDVSTAAIQIRAKTAAGAFYAVQTLRQLLPAETFSKGGMSKVEKRVSACKITDAPRFGYRGLHLDVGRHFFSIDFVKKYIDLLAMHKLNTFHWHLTDDQGWRIEIKKYPNLSKTAAYRNATLIGHYSDQPHQFDGKRYGGFYTQEEIADVIAYAAQRFVTIIPEIEMPGHAMAALAAYPELGCTGGPYEVASLWGIFDDVFCAGNEKTFDFIENVLAEVCELFPGTYIHIGGDECPKKRWETCPKCKKKMAEYSLKDGHDLQSYFIRRVERMLSVRGKKLIGWDEILEGGLAPGATVMSWRGTEGGIAAAREHHDVVMSPGSHCYFDHYQSDPTDEPVAIGGFTTLEKAYSYEPIPSELSPEEAQYILGAQANVWTEYMPTSDQVEYMAYPRVCALSEVVWTAKEKRNWGDFSARIRAHFARLDALGVNYAKSYYDVSTSFSNGKVSLSCADPNVTIRYTLDGKEPTSNALVYKAPFAIQKNTTLKYAAFNHPKRLGKVCTVEYLVHKASGKPYTLSRKPEQYTGGETYALTNGVQGARKTWSSWVGLVNKDIDPVIDFGKKTSFSKVKLNYLSSKSSWIYPPRAVEIYGSADGKDFKFLAQKEILQNEGIEPTMVENVVVNVPVAAYRYLKCVVKTFGVIPKDMPGADNGAWLFVDEIMVE